MSFLEQPRRSRSDSAHALGKLIRQHHVLYQYSRRHWPVVWLAWHMLASSAGGYWGTRHAELATNLPAPWASQLTRLAALLPVALGPAGGATAPMVWGAVGLSAGLASAVEASHRQRRSHATAPQPWATAVSSTVNGAGAVRITGWAQRVSDRRWRAPARLLAWRGPDPGMTTGENPIVGAGLLLSGPPPTPAPGQLLAGPLQVRVPPEASVPGSFDYRQFLAGRDLHWQAEFASTAERISARRKTTGCGRTVPRLRQAIIDRLAQLLPACEAQLAAAILLGVRTPESRALSAPYSRLGLAHLFAVSGLHVGILLGILLLPGRLLGVSPRLAAVPLWIFGPLYLLLTGLPGSVVRAGGMGLLAAQARPFGRRICTLRILGLLYWAGSVLDPVRNQDVGLRLSYLAAGGILLVGRASNGYSFTNRRRINVLFTGLAVSFAAQWFTLPIVAGSFGQISLTSPVANLLAVPAFGSAVWVIVSALIASTVWLPLGQHLAAWGWVLLRSLGAGVAWLDRHDAGLPLGLPVPGPASVGIWLVSSILLLSVLRRPGGDRGKAVGRFAAVLSLACLVLILFGPCARDLPATGSPIVWQFDVGQGDCGLLAFPDGWLAMIDTGGRYGHRAVPGQGPAPRQVLPFLRRHGVSHLDAVILTHGHLDHTGGAAAVAATLPVGRWYLSGHADAALPPGLATVERPTSGTVLHRWRDWTLAVHYPFPLQREAASENNWSLVVSLCRAGRTEMVWSGDLEQEGEARLLEAGTEPAATRVWKAGHHGSGTSGSPAWLRRLRPQLVLVSCGVDNRYGHPSHGPFLRSAATGADTIPLLRTDLEGSIRLQWHPDGSLRWRTRERAGQISRLP